VGVKSKGVKGKILSKMWGKRRSGVLGGVS